MKPHTQAIAGMIIAAMALLPSAAGAQHQGLFERGPKASVIGEHGAYNIAWITLQDQIFLQKPVYELMITYHPAGRGPGAVRQRHWDEMLQVASAEIAERCPPPAESGVLNSTQDYDPSERHLGAELRVTYYCH